jgi:hypothetical protein
MMTGYAVFRSNLGDGKLVVGVHDQFDQGEYGQLSGNLQLQVKSFSS